MCLRNSLRFRVPRGTISLVVYGSHEGQLLLLLFVADRDRLDKDFGVCTVPQSNLEVQMVFRIVSYAKYKNSIRNDKVILRTL